MEEAVTQRRRAGPTVERTVATLAVGAFVALVTGIVAVQLDAGRFLPRYPALDRYGFMAMGIAGILATAALAASIPVDRFHVVGRKRSGGKSYDTLRNWNRLKVSTILLNLITVLAFIVLVLGASIRLEWIRSDISITLLNQGVSVMALVSGTSLLYALAKSLRVPLERDKSGPTIGAAAMAMLFAVFVAIVAVIISSRYAAMVDDLGLRPTDAPMLVLASFALAGVAAFPARTLPGLYKILTEEQGAYRGRDYFSRTKAILMPVMLALSLLFLSIIVILLFRFGFEGALGEAFDRTLVVVVFSLLALGMLASLLFSITLSKQEDKRELYRTAVDPTRRIRTILAVGPGLLGFLLVTAGIVMVGGQSVAGIPEERWLDLISLGILVGVGPFAFYHAQQQKRIRSIEQQFPDFLRDLASSHAGGLTLPQSVHVAARGDYGELTSEIHKMADQLTWNVPFEEALRRFADRVHTPLVQRAVGLILEASRSGGQTTDVLLAAARDARELKILENERIINMSLYTIVIYVTFGVFLVVAAILFKSFVPQILASQEALAAAGASSGPFTRTSYGLQDYRAFYFTASLVQAVGNGIMAGLMGSGRALMGLRHVFLMVAITYVVFGFILI